MINEMEKTRVIEALAESVTPGNVVSGAYVVFCIGVLAYLAGEPMPVFSGSGNNFSLEDEACEYLMDIRYSCMLSASATAGVELPFDISISREQIAGDAYEYSNSSSNSFASDVAAFIDDERVADDGGKLMRFLQEESQEEVDSLCIKEGGLFDALNTLYSLVPDLNRISDDSKLSVCSYWVMAQVNACADYPSLYDIVSLSLQSDTVDAWLHYMGREAVSDEDRLGSARNFASLLSSIESSVAYELQYVVVSEFTDSDPVFQTGYRKNDERKFLITVIAEGDTPTYGGIYAEFINIGFLPPCILAHLIRIKHFLEEMDAKYHYLSREEALYGAA